jgi:hypothetical protein
MMNKHIRPVFLLNESKPFSVIKPLNSSINHNDILLSWNFQNRKLEDATLINGFFLQKEIAPPIKGEALLNDVTIIPNQPKSKLIVQNLSKKGQFARFQARFCVIGLSFSVISGMVGQ